MSKPIPVRLPERDIELIDEIVERKKQLFTNRSDFVRFAIEKTIFDTFKLESAARFLQEMGEKNKLSEKDVEKINKQVKNIRHKLMKEYYK